MMLDSPLNLEKPAMVMASVGRTPIIVNAGEAAAFQSDCPSAIPLSFLMEQWEN